MNGRVAKRLREYAFRVCKMKDVHPAEGHGSYRRGPRGAVETAWVWRRFYKGLKRLYRERRVRLAPEAMLRGLKGGA